MIRTKEELLSYKSKLEEQRKGRKTQILVGMSSCGIAAGARDVQAKFEEAVKAKNLPGVVVEQCGCVGYCYTEPTVEIIREDGTMLLLGPVTPADVQNVIDLHVVSNSNESKYVIPYNFKSCLK